VILPPSNQIKSTKMGAPTKMRRPAQLSHKTNSCKLQSETTQT
jgi:hypothetical protein